MRTSKFNSITKYIYSMIYHRYARNCWECIYTTTGKCHL